MLVKSTLLVSLRGYSHWCSYLGCKSATWRAAHHNSVLCSHWILPFRLLVSRIRENASFVYILTEVVILGVLGILWTITAALIIQDFNFWGCDGIYLSDKFDICEQLSAKKGLTVATFVLRKWHHQQANLVILSFLYMACF